MNTKQISNQDNSYEDKMNDNVDDKAFDYWVAKYHEECDRRGLPHLSPDREHTGNGYRSDGRFPSDDYILRDALGRSLAVCTSYLDVRDVDPRYHVETVDDVRALLSGDAGSSDPGDLVGELRQTIRAVVRERFPQGRKPAR